MNKVFFYVIVVPALLLGFASCSDNKSGSETDCNNTRTVSDSIYIYRTDTVVTYLHDTIYIKSKPQIVKEIVKETVYAIIPEVEMLDSMQTEKELCNIISYGFMLYQPRKSDIMPSLMGVDGLALLPYLFEMYSSNRIYPSDSYQYAWNLKNMCTTTIDDDKLFDCGKRIYESLDEKIPSKYGSYASCYPQKYQKSSDYKDRKVNIDYIYVSLDSLRVRVIAHNDREALEKLEKYYHDKGDDKGLAIYYKVMLGYEGNGDLAERFYRVLEPHFKDTPEFRGAVREVLLRSALCDGNARAQELCDSLGFSLCDYRLPRPNNDPNK